MPDVPYLYDKLSGREFLQFIADMYGLDPARPRPRSPSRSTAFELQEFVDDLTESYSHGMKQRLAFAAAMLHDPPVLVIDEPMVGLDPRSVRMVKDLLRAKAAGGQTIFMSTHLLSIAEEIADRIGIVDQGKLQVPGHDRRTARPAGHAREVAGAAVPELHGRTTVGSSNGHPPGDSISSLNEERRW